MSFAKLAASHRVFLLSVVKSIIGAGAQPSGVNSDGW